jgi:hypothetical protein
MKPSCVKISNIQKGDNSSDVVEEYKPCPICGEPGPAKYIHVTHIACWKCHKTMKLAAFRFDYSWSGARDFSEKDCVIAGQLGAIINMVYGKTRNESFLASCCGHCQAFSGDFFLHDYFYDLEKQGKNKIFSGYYCEECEKHFE